MSSSTEQASREEVKHDWPLFKARGPAHRELMAMPYYSHEKDDDRVDKSKGPQGHSAWFNMKIFDDEPALFYDVSRDPYYKNDKERQAAVELLMKTLSRPGEKFFNVYDRRTRKITVEAGEVDDLRARIKTLEAKLKKSS